MSDIIKAVQSIQQFKINQDKIHIEDAVFRLFSRLTVGCLILCAALVTMQQLVGEHIKCILPPKEDVRHESLNQYCFIMSTYTVPGLYNRTVGLQIAHHGVGPHNPEEDEQRYHYYYQWVPFALFFQGLSFLIPHYLWKAFEEERVKAYCNLELAPKKSFKKRDLFNEGELTSKDKMINKAAICFVGNLSYNKTYAYFYILCELFNFSIVLLNFHLTNKFLGNNSFNSYGPDVLNFLSDNPDTDSDNNPMNRVFPKVAKCDFNKYGPSGNIIRYDILCVLALNIVNEKIYLFLWFWFVILSIFGGLQLIYRIVLLFLPGIRHKIILNKVARNYKSALTDVLRDTGYADWFLLKLLSENIDTMRFGELCDSIKDVLWRRQTNGRLSSSPPPSYIKEKDIDEDPLMSA